MDGDFVEPPQSFRLWNPLTRYNSNSTESHAADCRTITIQSFITMSAVGHAALM